MFYQQKTVWLNIYKNMIFGINSKDQCYREGHNFLESGREKIYGSTSFQRAHCAVHWEKKTSTYIIPNILAFFESVNPSSFLVRANPELEKQIDGLWRGEKKSEIWVHIFFITNIITIRIFDQKILAEEWKNLPPW